MINLRDLKTDTSNEPREVSVGDVLFHCHMSYYEVVDVTDDDFAVVSVECRTLQQQRPRFDSPDLRLWEHKDGAPLKPPTPAQTESPSKGATPVRNAAGDVIGWASRKVVVAPNVVVEEVYGGGVPADPAAPLETLMLGHRACGHCGNIIRAAHSWSHADLPAQVFCNRECCEAARSAVIAQARAIVGSAGTRSPQTRDGLRRLIEQHIPAWSTLDSMLLRLLSPETIARAFWETDPEVVKLVTSKADAVVRLEANAPLKYEGRADRYSRHHHDPEQAKVRLQRALDVAWRIDDGGLRSKWLEHVNRVLQVNRGT